MKRIILILLSMLFVSGVGYSQAPIKRKKKEKTEQTQSSSSSRKQQQATNNKKKTTSSVKVSEPDGYINGHGYVDLGLPSGTKWATCNVGASTSSEYGNYYAWGERSIKTSYTRNNSLINGKNHEDLLRLGITNSDRCISMNYDTARFNFGVTWRMPTKEEFDELLTECSWIWANINGYTGYQVVGSNGKSIFLPAAGWHDISSVKNVGERGYYWCANYISASSPFQLAISPSFYNTAYVGWDNNFQGYSIRAVTN